MDKQLIIGIGEILWDVYPTHRKPGGAPANFAFYIRQFGLESLLVSAVGRDTLGYDIKDFLQSLNLRFQIETVEYPTGTVDVTLDNNGIPNYEIREKVAWDYIPYNEHLSELSRKTKAVCFGSLAQRSDVSHNTIMRFLKALPADVLRVCDINLRQHFYSKQLIEDLLMNCNILKVSDEELLVIASLFDWQFDKETDICFRIIEIFAPEMIILTKGAQGSFVVTLDETFYQPSLDVEVIDTVGAGDAFTATFVASLLKGATIEEAQKIATNVAGYICTHEGTMVSLPNDMKNF